MVHLTLFLSQLLSNFVECFNLIAPFDSKESCLKANIKSDFEETFAKNSLLLVLLAC